MDDPSLLIIGGGFAGLSAGIYAQMNGYQSHIYEMGDGPGGLCTAWKRKDYTIDGCIHWLVGSSPKSSLHRLWTEVGLIQGREFVDLDQFMRFEGADGRTFIVYTDADKLEQHMLALSPDDAAVTRRFIEGIRLGIAYDRLQVLKSDNRLQRMLKRLRMGLLMVRKATDLQIWLRTTAEEFANRFADPLIRQALLEMWFPEFSMFFLLFTLSYLHNKNAGYPLGGSLPMSKALEQRYLGLGGQIHYQS
jgi:phytoene dehydrogenase-like protein